MADAKLAGNVAWPDTLVRQLYNSLSHHIRQRPPVHKHPPKLVHPSVPWKENQRVSWLRVYSVNLTWTGHEHGYFVPSRLWMCKVVVVFWCLYCKIYADDHFLSRCMLWMLRVWVQIPGSHYSALEQVPSPSISSLGVKHFGQGAWPYSAAILEISFSTSERSVSSASLVLPLNHKPCP